MENLEKQFEQELSASRMQIELLRNQVLLQYYTQLLELDPLLQPQEVKALMSCINTLERYARKYDSKKKHNDTTQASSATQQSARSDNENIDSNHSQNQYFKTSDRIPIKKYPGNQFRMRYSLGVTPTFCLNKRLKCCGYLNPKL